MENLVLSTWWNYLKDNKIQAFLSSGKLGLNDSEGIQNKSNF